jgi:hypothetical protein
MSEGVRDFKSQERDDIFDREGDEGEEVGGVGEDMLWGDSTWHDWICAVTFPRRGVVKGVGQRSDTLARSV